MRVTHPLTRSLALALALFVGACGGEPASDERGRDANGAIPAVEVIQAVNGSLPLEERLSGVVRAENQVALFPEIAANVVRVTAQNGDFVRAGQPLVYLRNTQFQEQIRQAEAALKINQADAKRTAAELRELNTRLDRTRQLAEKQFQSEQELQAIEAQVAVAEAAHEQVLARIAQAEATLAEQQEALRRTVIRAPISGYVGQRNAEVGMRADPGTPLFILGNFSMVKVEVAITDAMIGRIEPGQTAIITLEDQGGRKVRAEVSRISPFLEAGSYSAEAEIDVANPDGLLRPGMFVAVDILYGESELATLVPQSALYEDPSTGAMGVYLATSLGTETPLREPETFDKDNPPALTEPTPMAFREVNVLARGRGLAGVTGVQAGDWVVTVGQNLLKAANGERVEARVRPVNWERVAALQNLQDQDLLRQFMEKQQRLSRERFDEEQARDADTTAAGALVPTSASMAP